MFVISSVFHYFFTLYAFPCSWSIYCAIFGLLTKKIIVFYVSDLGNHVEVRVLMFRIVLAIFAVLAENCTCFLFFLADGVL